MLSPPAGNAPIGGKRHFSEVFSDLGVNVTDHGKEELLTCFVEAIANSSPLVALPSFSP